MSKNWTAAKEKASREWIKSTIIEVVPNLPVSITTFDFTSVEDFIGQMHPTLVGTMTEEEYDKFECDFAMIYYLRFQDSKTEGCDDNPVVFVFYNVHIFKAFKDVRGDLTNSHDELLAHIVDLHNKFLDDTEHATYGKALQRFPVEQPNNMVRRGQSEFLTGQRGDFVNFEVKMEVRES